MKVTRTAQSKNLNKGKYQVLEEQARRLGAIRSEVWQRYGSMGGMGLSDRKILDAWLKEKRVFPVLANAWKETLRDAKTNIEATMEAAKVRVKQAIRRHTDDEQSRKDLYTQLKSNQFTDNRYLSRVMRKYWQRGHNHTYNQIIVRSDDYTTFELGGRIWIKIPSLERSKRIAIPLNTNVVPTGMLRLIVRNGSIDVHYTIEVAEIKNCGNKTVGIDKGYTEVLVDSEGEHHGGGFSELLKAESDTHQRRAKLRAIANKTRYERKQKRILKHNLGNKKRYHRARKIKARISDTIYKAIHAVVDKAAVIAAEDLTAAMSGKKFSKEMNRRLASWTKGVIAKAIDNVSRRRGSTVVLINPAYTSQIDSRNGCLMGRRNGEQFNCFDGVVLQADENAARNVLARLFDPEIDRWMPFQKVKSILLQRTECLRLGLLNPDSSCKPQGLSTESELPNYLNSQFWPSF